MQPPVAVAAAACGYTAVAAAGVALVAAGAAVAVVAAPKVENNAHNS